MYPYNCGSEFPRVLGVTPSGKVVATNWGTCPRCGEERFFVAPCHNNPMEELSHREVGYCIKCGQGRDVPPLHMSEGEAESLPAMQTCKEVS